MKKLNELKEKRADLISQMEELTAGETMTDEQKTSWESFSGEVDTLTRDINIAEKQEELNKQAAAFSVNTDPETEETSVDMVSGLKEFFATGIAPKEFRSDRGGFVIPNEVIESFGDLKTTTDTAIINKTVMNGISIAKSPAESMLSDLGVTNYAGLTGNFVVPSMAQLNAGFKAEGVAVADASGTPASLTLAARRVGAYNTFTKEFLAQTNPAIYQGIVQDLYDAVWRAVAGDLFDNIETDAIDASVAQAGTNLAATDFSQLQANVLYDAVSPAYVTTGGVAAYAKHLASVSSVAGPVWQGSIMDGNVDGIKAKGTSFANANKLYYGDFSKAVVGQWGGIELLVNPYEFDAEGKIKVTASGLFDTGIPNYRYFSWVTDVSAAI